MNTRDRYPSGGYVPPEWSARAQQFRLLTETDHSTVVAFPAPKQPRNAQANIESDDFDDLPVYTERELDRACKRVAIGISGFWMLIIGGMAVLLLSLGH